MDEEKRKRLLAQAASGDLSAQGQRALSNEANKMLELTQKTKAKEAGTAELITHEIHGLIYSAEVVGTAALAGVVDGRYDASDYRGFNVITGLSLGARVLGSGMALAKRKGASHLKAMGDGGLAYCAGKRGLAWGQDWKAKAAGNAAPGQAAAPAVEPGKGGPAIAGVPNARVLPDQRDIARQVHAQHAGRVVMTPPHAAARGEKGREWRNPA